MEDALDILNKIQLLINDMDIKETGEQDETIKDLRKQMQQVARLKDESNDRVAELERENRELKEENVRLTKKIRTSKT